MGQAASGGLTQNDVDAIMTASKGVFNQAEIESLYKRFRSLDRGRKGYISADEFLAIPELSINPVAQRLVRLFECCNFKDFAKLLAALSPRATRDDKLAYMFMVYDIDGDGAISRDDMGIMLKQLAGSSLSEDDLQDIISRVLRDAGNGERLDLAAFRAALADADLTHMVVEVPIELDSRS